MQRENAVAPPTRRLAAILCADLCGYSKLMAEDEASTLRLLARYRSISETIVRQFGGRIANTAGDGLLIEFSSALDALQGALDIQARIALANEDVQPSRKGSFRIGFHIGEVSVRYGDLFGDAVNIAARLQAIAPAGRVCLSNVAYQFVSKLNGVLFEPYGIHELKNLPNPMEVFLASSHQYKRGEIPTVHRRILFHLARRFESVCESALLNITSQVGLATIEYAAIASLDDAPDLTADELAVRMGMKPALASSILDRITTRGLVSQQSGEEGRYRLSEDGYEVRQRLKPAVIDAIDRIVSPLSDIERSTLHDMLARIIQANEDTIIDAQR